MMSTHFEYKRLSAAAFNPAEVVAACIENGYGALFLDSTELPREFFDLSSGVAGDLAARLSLYGITMAAVVPDLTVHSRPFQDFVREANRGKQFHFVCTREEAIAWLDNA